MPNPIRYPPDAAFFQEPLDSRRLFGIKKFAELLEAESHAFLLFDEPDVLLWSWPA